MSEHDDAYMYIAKQMYRANQLVAHLATPKFESSSYCTCNENKEPEVVITYCNSLWRDFVGKPPVTKTFVLRNQKWVYKSSGARASVSDVSDIHLVVSSHLKLAPHSDKETV